MDHLIQVYLHTYIDLVCGDAASRRTSEITCSGSRKRERPYVLCCTCPLSLQVADRREGGRWRCDVTMLSVGIWVQVIYRWKEGDSVWFLCVVFQFMFRRALVSSLCFFRVLFSSVCPFPRYFPACCFPAYCFPAYVIFYALFSSVCSRSLQHLHVF